MRGKRTASELFIELCEEIASRYRGWGTVHLVVDNYGIHSSKKTREALDALGGKIVLHFLPGYSPEYNEIEPVWGVLHDAITRCHRHPDIDALCDQVERFLTHVRDHGLDNASLFEDPSFTFMHDGLEVKATSFASWATSAANSLLFAWARIRGACAAT